VGEKISDSQIFMVENFLANGNHDKMKARIVADERGQYSAFFPNKPSSTVVLLLVFALLACTQAWEVMSWMKWT
jgi:hypothetical protein